MTGSSPPAWAEWLLPRLLDADKQETVSGDLLEEYRETALPARGRWRANVWYVRHVAGFLWRLSLPWGILIGAKLVIRLLADTYAPPANYSVRAAVTTWLAVGVCLTVGGYTAYRTRHAGTGTIIAIASHAIGAVIAGAFSLVLFVAVIEREPNMLREFEATGGFGEIVALPVMLLPIVALLGLIGGAVGKWLGGITRGRTAVRGAC